MWVETKSGRKYLLTLKQIATGSYDPSVHPKDFKIVNELPSEESPPIPVPEEEEEHKPTRSEIEEEHREHTEQIKQLRREIDAYNAGIIEGRKEV